MEFLLSNPHHLDFFASQHAIRYTLLCDGSKRMAHSYARNTTTTTFLVSPSFLSALFFLNYTRLEHVHILFCDLMIRLRTIIYVSTTILPAEKQNTRFLRTSTMARLDIVPRRRPDSKKTMCLYVLHSVLKKELTVSEIEERCARARPPRVTNHIRQWLRTVLT